VKGKTTAGVINPATGKVFAQVPECTREQLDEAMNAAHSAFAAWSRDVALRRKVLLDCATAIKKASEGLVPLLTQEQGKPLAKAEEIFAASIWFEYTANLEIPVDVLQDDQSVRIEIRRRPLGVVAAITPWNFPLLLAVWKIAPSLLAGNTVVIKPSPFTLLTTLMLGEILRGVVPNGVVNVVSGATSPAHG
jgi:acyl-CoA reductase-like NAD-dependent aldehyde dehydrogenase